MGSYSQEHRQLKVTTALGADAVLLEVFQGSSGLSQLFRFELDLLAEHGTPVPFDKLLGQPIAVELKPRGGEHVHYHGIVSQLARERRHVPGRDNKPLTSFKAVMVPKLWL